MNRKIFLNYIILIIIALFISGFFASEISQKFYQYEVEQKLVSVASLIKSSIIEAHKYQSDLDYNRLASEYSSILQRPMSSYKIQEEEHIRLTFIDFDGKVLGETETDYSSMENHLNRKEVQQALKGLIGKDIRSSSTLKAKYLYIAMPAEPLRVIVRASVPLVKLEVIDRIIIIYILAGMLIGLLVTSLLALKFSFLITSPINEFIKASREISTGNYKKRVTVRSHDEIAQLAETFNKMADTLEATVNELVQENAKVDSIINSILNGIIAVDRQKKIIFINDIACDLLGIHERSLAAGKNIIEVVRNAQINSMLNDTLEKNISLSNEVFLGVPGDRILKVYTNPIKTVNNNNNNSGSIIFLMDITNIRKLEQIRTEFVSNVTHELKTPLTSIRGFIETLRNGAIDDKEVASRFLEIIDIEAERLYMLINDILQLSEIESRHQDINIGMHNLKSIIDETISILHGVADLKNVSLYSQVDENITIMANRDRIKQMMINLIDNAIKYNYENGYVHIHAYKAEGKIIITVKDNGIGIPPEHLPRIFERFYRVDKGRSRNMGGTGLGLSIVKHIVNLYNGDIKVNSSVGAGTEFTIQLPI